MKRGNRREFLAGVGRGMLVAGVGYSMAVELGLSPVLADEGTESLSFGALEPLVAMIQETPVERIQPLLVERIRQGANLRELSAAAALANARTFGGEDYVGFHTFMAMSPAVHMSGELPAERRPLPVLKVLYRNSTRMQEQGGRKHEVLHAVQPAALSPGESAAEMIRDAVHRRDVTAAERALAAATARSPDDAWNDLLPTVHESTEVHRVVLAHRAWDMWGLVGREWAEVMLRQSLRFCVKAEEVSLKHFAEPRALLPSLLDQYRLVGQPRGTRAADDAWIDQMSKTLFASTAAQAAEAVAAALAEGMSPESVAEAISLAANQLVLRDAGRPPNQAQPGKPVGSTHGDSVGVHACDSANAWRHMALASNQRNMVASLILSGYQVALDRGRSGNFLEWKPRPYAEQLAALRASDGESLLKELDGAIREQNQDQACALVHRYGELGFEPRPVFNLLLRYAISEDGALHAEKYYRTASDEFASTRPAFRWRQLVALARVTASEYGRPAPGYAEACELLNI